MQPYVTPAPGRTPAEQTKPKRGRPRKANPLTPAQRHARWRAKRKAEVQELLKIYHEVN